MRVLIFHGYLLRGTGSNIYTASLARALAALGHEVELVCQERRANELDLPAAVRVTTPDIGRTLPVYVADEYEGFDAVPYPELDGAALAHYLDANVRAVREVVARRRPDVALANHLISGPAILARALGGRVPYAVKIHGSALEYAVRPHRQRFLALAREGLAGAGGVLVGSGHTARSLWEVMDDPELPGRTRLGPPGVDVEAFRPRPAPQARRALDELARRLEGGSTAAWGGEEGAAAAVAALDPRAGPIVTFVGKLIVSKGVDLLLAAWPLVSAAVPGAQLVVVGFGGYRAALGELVDALAAGDLAAVRALAARGREPEGGPAGGLSMLASFCDSLDGRARARWEGAAPAAARTVAFTGRLEHRDLPPLLAASDSLVVPSTFPEAFGMVAAEGACCAALPLSASHSGLAEVTATLAGALEGDRARLLSFRLGPGAVEAIADRLTGWLRLPAAERAAAAAAVSDLARRRYGWEGVARGVIAAAEGRLGELDPVAPAPPHSGRPSG